MSLKMKYILGLLAILNFAQTIASSAVLSNSLSLLQKDAVNHLKNLIRIPSISPSPGEADVANYLTDSLIAAGYVLNEDCYVVGEMFDGTITRPSVIARVKSHSPDSTEG